jgi:hypothetical protein
MSQSILTTPSAQLPEIASILKWLEAGTSHGIQLNASNCSALLEYILMLEECTSRNDELAQVLEAWHIANLEYHDVFQTNLETKESVARMDVAIEFETRARMRVLEVYRKNVSVSS